MEELAKKIQQKYIDDLSSKYPLHRFFCLYVYLLSIYIYFIKKDLRLLVSINEIKVSFLFDFSKGLLSEVTVFNLLMAIILTLVTAKLSLIIKNKFFQLIYKLKIVDGYLIKLKQIISVNQVNNSSVKYSMTSDISKQLELKRSLLRSKQAISEIVLTSIICLLIGIQNMTVIDWYLVVGGFLIIIYAQWDSLKLYISEFLPYFVAEQVSIGNEISFLTKNNEPHA